MFEMISRVRQWLWQHLEWCMFAVVAMVGLSLILTVLLTHWGFYQGDADGSRLYLLSSIVQGLAAILALLVTLSLIASQLAAGAYTPRVISHRLTDFWLWFAILIYLAAIGWSLVVLSALKGWSHNRQQDSIDVALILAGIALAYIIPFTLAILKGLQPARIARWLIQKDDYVSLEELMRKAVNEGVMTLLLTTLTLFTEKAKKRLADCKGAPHRAEEVSAILISVGRHSCQRRSPDALAEVMKQLTDLIRYCNEPSRLWREAADVFNEAARELYAYSEEWIGRAEP